MIVYFANRKMEIIGHASTKLPSGLVISEDLKREEVDTGVATFSCTIGFTKGNRSLLEKMTEAGNYLLRRNKRGQLKENEFYTIIDSEIDTKKQEIYIYAEDAGLDLINEIVGAFETTEAHTADWYVTYFAGDSGFEIGINEIPKERVRALAWEGESTVTERLSSVANAFGGFEVSYSFDVKGMKVTRKLINIYTKRGKDIQEELRLNRDIDRIITKKSIANVGTALEVTGGLNTKKNVPVTLAGYSYDDGDIYVDGTMLKSRKALEKWGRFIGDGFANEGHIKKQYSYDTTSQSELCNRAITELKKIRDMEVNYEIDISKLPDNVEIGDRVNIVDADGKLYLSARILVLEISVSEGTQKAVLGEYLIKDSGISSKVTELAQQFAQMAKARTFYTWVAYADDERGNGIATDPAGKDYMGTAVNQLTEDVDITDASIYKWVKVRGDGAVSISISSSNGTIFKGTKIETLLVAHVFREGRELTADEIAQLGSINWYKDGGNVVVGTGKNLAINAGDVENKATYIAKLEV